MVMMNGHQYISREVEEGHLIYVLASLSLHCDPMGPIVSPNTNFRKLSSSFQSVYVSSDSGWCDA